MLLGLSLAVFTQLHVVLSLIGIVAGFAVLFALLSGRLPGGWNAAFLASTIATSVTGFLFPVDRLLPSHVFGIVSLLVLAVALVALLGRHLSGPWRAAYVVTAAVALYLNSFVGVVQAFLKLPALHALAPTGTELPFALAQLVLLVAMVVLTLRALRRFRPA